jgi:DnaK suppressor protein
MAAPDIRTVLLSERERLVEELATARAEAGVTVPDTMLGEFERYGQHPSELASDTLEREVELSIARDLAAQIDDVDDALHRLDRGRYGLCEVCGQPIVADRLVAMPAARRCIADQTFAEHFSGRDDLREVPSSVMEDALTDDDNEGFTVAAPNEEAAMHIEPTRIEPINVEHS